MFGLIVGLDELSAAFKKHVETYGGLDLCINNAGIANPVPFNKDNTDGSKSWRLTVNVNLIAVIDCTRLAVKYFKVLLFYVLPVD